MQRIGVFVCHCGTNIAGTVDVKAVAEALQNEPGVAISTDYPYMCSQAGQDMIRAAIAEHKLTGIVVCSCSPRKRASTARSSSAVTFASFCASTVPVMSCVSVTVPRRRCAV